MTKETDIRDASARFYAALNDMANGNAASMADCWATSPETSAQHPIGGRDDGTDAVLGSFAKVASIAEGGKISIADQHFDIGQDMAVETGVETGSVKLAGHTANIEHRVTNVYCLDDGVWKLRHHHTDKSPEMLDILAKLEPAV